MQVLILKKFAFFSFILMLVAQLAVAQPPITLLRKADSLFATGQYAAAGKLYTLYEQQDQPVTDPLLLKLAYVQEKEGNVARLLYYLQRYFDRRPDEAVLKKMHEVASEHNLMGYETDDLNYFYLFYKQYGLYAIMGLLVMGAYVFGIFWMKHHKQESIRRQHKWVVLLYLLSLLLLVNLTERYQSGIVNRDHVFLRQQPSAAAPVASIIGKGHKVNILGSQDIWLRIYWNDGLYYVRRDTVWEI
ncbi:SH3 domain-containing protein [Tellurirhabdus bombi]|uniref:SH3 domain-containing protein n=1 Tax=Tellurirhabdus bombi TaxID=2907205 RepID=UPI001F2E5733|nr:SH3 domain-containing protein [Tellurirhabdus bombi]